jgi:hypothetical protein
MDYDPTPEELAMAASGLPQLAFGFVDALRRGDAEAVWIMSDPQFRLGLVQLWITHNHAALRRDMGAERFKRDELAEQLAREVPDGPLWEQCGRVSVRTIVQASGGYLDVELGIGTSPRLLAADLEQICLVPVEPLRKDEHGIAVIEPGVFAAFSLVARISEGRWRVAGIGDHILVPGWPPQHQQVAQIEE